MRQGDCKSGQLGQLRETLPQKKLNQKCLDISSRSIKALGSILTIEKKKRKKEEERNSEGRGGEEGESKH